MGIAEVIPGVSGGTIAFITGIYERLIRAIKNILGPEILNAFREGGVAEAWRRIDGAFVLSLIVGMSVGVITGVLGVSHLLENYPELLWAFFFGLILASAAFIARQVTKWGSREIATLIFGALIAFVITIATPAQGSDALWFVFIAGAIAISALILPGVSGSFVLLLMGMYATVIGTVKSLLENFEAKNLIILIVFALGCLTGLATFSRVLSWMFKKYHNITLALLTGFMLGSLNKIWPWRNVLEYRINSSGEQVPFLERSVLPMQYEGDPMVGGVLICMVIGFAVVFILERVGQKRADV
jgi:putative membrane protein